MAMARSSASDSHSDAVDAITVDIERDSEPNSSLRSIARYRTLYPIHGPTHEVARVASIARAPDAVHAG